jgi:DNA-binding CsgD family transcriptional regulator
VRALQGELAEAQTLLDVGGAAGRAARRLVGISAFNFFPLGLHVKTTDDITAWSDHFSREYLITRTLRDTATTEADVGGSDRLFAHPRRTLDLNKLFGPSWQRTRTYNENWRECKIERQLLATVGPPTDPRAFLCLSRSAAERPFTDEHLRKLDRMRRACEAAIVRIDHRARQRAGADALLSALEEGLPFACALFDATGRLAWLSRVAMVRFETSLARMGSTPVLAAVPAELAQWSAAALAVLRERPQAPATPEPPATTAAAPPHAPVPIRSVAARAELAKWSDAVAASAARPSNACESRSYGGLAVRRVDREGAPPLFLVTAEASPAPCLRRLSPREREIAELAAHGYSVLNLSQQLGIAEGTARNHLKHVYRKLGVCSRVDLARRVWGA